VQTDQVLEIVSRIYDTTLNKSLWPSVLHDIARATGASGAMIFELTQADGIEKISCPYQSANYDPAAVQDYLRKHNAQEIKDQAEFARISGEGAEISLVNDDEFTVSQDVLQAQSNVQDMMKFGLCHRSGTLLNKDSWRIDRFSLQYRKDRGASTDAEKRLANAILPHVAKALRIGRPLNENLVLGSAFGRHVNNLDFGMCLLSPKGFPIATNLEFDRIVADAPVFQYLSTGQLALGVQHDEDRYRALISNDAIHGQAGAYPRRQSLFFPQDENETGIFVEICPVSENDEFGRLPPHTRLITAMDSGTFKSIGADVVSRFFPLSKSEEAVLQLIGAGRTNKEIAALRNRSLETVNSQVKSLLFKTHTRNRTELVQLSLSLAAPFSGAKKD
jgi:DNA-binding CsgD family transcriptional regulator